jgi:hypothetical protein
MSHPSSRPKAWRVLLGFLLAPLMPAILFSLIASGDLSTVSAALIFGGYPPAIVLGVPAYLLLRNRLSPHFWLAMLAGGIIAALPWVALALLPPAASYAEVGQCVSVIDGKHTWCGFWESAKFASIVFALGALGGLVFWLCAVWRGLEPKPTT